MDFEEFRKKKEEKKKLQKEAEERAKKQATEPTASGKKLDWIDGIGPAGPRNPKVKGFMLGRYRKVRVDPRTLKKPEGYEKTGAGGPSAMALKTKAEMELEKRKAALAKAEADLEAAEQKRKEAEIEERRKAQGFTKIKKQRW